MFDDLKVQFKYNYIINNYLQKNKLNLFRTTKLIEANKKNLRFE